MKRRTSRVASTKLTLAVLGMSAALAGTISFGVYATFRSYDQLLDMSATSIATSNEPIEVVVAARTLGRGTTITADDLQVFEIGRDFVPTRAITDPAALVGRVVRERVLQGDLLRPERLAAVNSGEGLTATVPTGMRAIGLDLGDTELVSGFIEPGDHVDVVVTIPDSDSREAETRTLLQAVQVLAVKQHMSATAVGDEAHATGITLSVSPDQAERLTLIAAEAIPTLILRAEIDFVPSSTVGATSDDILGRPDLRMSVAQYRDRVDETTTGRHVELYRGRDHTRELVKADDGRVMDAVMSARSRAP